MFSDGFIDTERIYCTSRVHRQICNQYCLVLNRERRIKTYRYIDDILHLPCLFMARLADHDLKMAHGRAFLGSHSLNETTATNDDVSTPEYHLAVHHRQ